MSYRIAAANCSRAALAAAGLSSALSPLFVASDRRLPGCVAAGWVLFCGFSPLAALHKVQLAVTDTVYTSPLLPLFNINTACAVTDGFACKAICQVTHTERLSGVSLLE